MGRRKLVTATLYAVGIALLGLIVSGLLSNTRILNRWIPNLPPEVERARSRIKIGDEREKAVQTLADAWYHGVCGAGYDIFLFGPHDRQTVRVVLLHSQTIAGEAFVDFIGSEESYRLFLWEHCLPPNFLEPD